MPQDPLVAKGIPVLSARELWGREVPWGLAWRSVGLCPCPMGPGPLWGPDDTS